MVSDDLRERIDESARRRARRRGIFCLIVGPTFLALFCWRVLVFFASPEDPSILRPLVSMVFLGGFGW